MPPPVVITRFQAGFHWILYYLEHGDLVIANMGDIEEEPHLWRQR